MKKKIIMFFKIQAIIYWSCYLIRTFCIFKFTNPFQWIIDMPLYSVEDRAFGLATYLFVFCLPIIAFMEMEMIKIKK